MCFDAPFTELLTGLCQKRPSFILIFWASMGQSENWWSVTLFIQARVFMCLFKCVSVCECLCHTLFPRVKKLWLGGKVKWHQRGSVHHLHSVLWSLPPPLPSSRPSHPSTSHPRTPAPTIKRKLNDSLYCISPPTLQSENIKNKRQERACTPLAESIEHSSYSFLSF